MCQENQSLTRSRPIVWGNHFEPRPNGLWVKSFQVQRVVKRSQSNQPRCDALLLCTFLFMEKYVHDIPIKSPLCLDIWVAQQKSTTFAQVAWKQQGGCAGILRRQGLCFLGGTVACFGQLQGGSGVSWATEVMTGYVYNITLYHPIKKLGLTWVNNQTTVFFPSKLVLVCQSIFKNQGLTCLHSPEIWIQSNDMESSPYGTPVCRVRPVPNLWAL